MTATIALPRQPHSDWLARIRTVGLGLGGRGVMGLGLGRSSVQAAEASWWLSGGISAANAIAVYQPKGAASLAASYTNLASPGTYDAAPGVAPTFDAATGWTFNGSTQYLYTGPNFAGCIIPAVGWSILVRFSDVTNGGYLFHVYSNNYHWSISPKAGASGVDYIFAGSDRYQTPELLAGVLGIAGGNAYRNGTLDRTLPGTPIFSELCLGRGVPSGIYIAAKIQAVAIYNTTLTAPQAAAVSAAMAAL